MIEFPDDLPEWAAEAIQSLEDRRRVMMLDAAKNSEICRGYFMAVEDLLNEIDQQVKLETARREDAHRKAGEAYLRDHGEPA